MTKLGEGGLPDNPLFRLEHLNSNLEALHRSSKMYQDKLKRERAAKGVEPEMQNLYQPGDLDLYDKGANVVPKMSHRYAGPYKVKAQYKNDVDCQHLVTGQGFVWMSSCTQVLRRLDTRWLCVITISTKLSLSCITQQAGQL